LEEEGSRGGRLTASPYPDRGTRNLPWNEEPEDLGLKDVAEERYAVALVATDSTAAVRAGSIISLNARP
jgi:hypothetical protein